MRLQLALSDRNERKNATIRLEFCLLLWAQSHAKNTTEKFLVKNPFYGAWNLQNHTYIQNIFLYMEENSLLESFKLW